MPWEEVLATLLLVFGGVFGMEMYARYAHKVSAFLPRSLRPGLPPPRHARGACSLGVRAGRGNLPTTTHAHDAHATRHVRAGAVARL
jgi:hypothetical protein